MLYQLSEIDFAVIDSLADGGEPVSLLIRELHAGKHAWGAEEIIRALAGLVEKQMSRCIHSPSGMTFTNPSREALQEHITALPDNSEKDYWFELTETGQTVWENWRQLRPG
jgi:hypothetical protein